MSRLALLACLALAACAPLPPPALGPTATFGVAGQVVAAQATADAARLTAQAAQIGQGEAAIRAADATAAALATQAAHSLHVQETADALALERLALDVELARSDATRSAESTAAAGTQAAYAGATATWLAATATAAPATATAAMANALATETIRRKQQETLVATASGAGTFLLKLVLFFAGLLGLIWLGGVIGADIERRRNNAAYRETPLGPILLLSDGRGQIAAQLLSAPAAPLPAPEPAMPADAPPPTITVNHKGRPAATIVADWRRPAASAEREAVAELLRAAIAVEGQTGVKIPRYTRLAGWETNPDGWKRQTDRLLLAGHVTKQPGRGGGTFLTGGRTLYQLLAGVLDRSLSLAPVDVVAENVVQNIS